MATEKLKAICLVSKITVHWSLMYQKKKAMLAISTMHEIGSIDPATGDHKKPVIINTYNETKFSVDILDEMSRQV